jgi:hypothetical protein
MNIASVGEIFSKYNNITKEFLTNSLCLVQSQSLVELFADSLLQPLRLCLHLKSRRISIVNEKAYLEEEQLNATANLFTLAFGLPLALKVGKLTSGIFLILNMGTALHGGNSAIGLLTIAGICHSVFSISANPSGSLLWLTEFFVGATILGIALKGINWKFNPHIVDKYRQYLQQERTICEQAAFAVTRYKQEHWENLSTYEGYKEKLINFPEAVYLADSVNRASITQLPHELLIHIFEYLDQPAINNLSSVSGKFKNLILNQHSGFQTRQKALSELRRVFGDQRVEAIGIANLMAYPPLRIPYRICDRKIQNVMFVQRCGSSTISQTITLVPHELGGKKVRWGWDPIAFIAILKESCFDDASTGLKQYVEVISSNQKLNIY